jgi:ATP-dependent protease ClpP protease subunit
MSAEEAKDYGIIDRVIVHRAEAVDKDKNKKSG